MSSICILNSTTNVVENVVEVDDINNIPSTGCNEARKKHPSLLLGIIIGLSVLFVLILGVVIYTCRAQKNTKTVKYVPLEQKNLIF